MTSHPPVRFYSIQSQKGGVGKTTIALHLARLLLAEHTVLVLDLDLAGTMAADAADALGGIEFWEGKLNVVTGPKTKKSEKREPVNLVAQFASYMTGEPLPTIEANEIKPEDISAKNQKWTIIPGRINIFSAGIDRDGDKSASGSDYGPSVLYDSLHAQWFLEMVKEIVKSCRTALSPKKLAVICDNAPGYSGLEPALEEWLTDLGPEHGKFLFVASPDLQDRKAALDAQERVQKLYADKCKAATLYRGKDEKARQADLNERQDAFFMRLSETASDEPDNCAYPKPAKDKHQSCRDCDLCYYRCGELGAKPKAKSKAKSGPASTFVQIVANKVPVEFHEKSLVEDFRIKVASAKDGKAKDASAKDATAKEAAAKEAAKKFELVATSIPLGGDRSIPFLPELAYQFFSHGIQMKTEGAPQPERKSFILFLEKEKRTLQSECRTQLDGILRLTELTPTSLTTFWDTIFNISDTIDAKTVEAFGKFASPGMSGSERTKDGLWLSRFARVLGRYSALLDKNYTPDIIKNSSRKLAERVIRKEFPEDLREAIHGISPVILSLDIMVLAGAFSMADFDVAGSMFPLICELDKFYKAQVVSGELLPDSVPANASSLKNYDEFMTLLVPLYIRGLSNHDELDAFYRAFHGLRQSLLRLPDEIAFALEILQTLAGMPRDPLIYGPTLLALAREVLGERRIDLESGRRTLRDIGLPQVDLDAGEVTFAPHDFERFRQRRAYEEIDRVLKVVVGS